MEINVNHTQKIVDIWLSKEETQNTALQEKLKPVYQRFKAQKYLVAVFRSGDRDLAEAASDLLCYNRKRTARLEVERQRKNIPV